MTSPNLQDEKPKQPTKQNNQPTNQTNQIKPKQKEKTTSNNNQMRNQHRNNQRNSINHSTIRMHNYSLLGKNSTPTGQTRSSSSKMLLRKFANPIILTTLACLICLSVLFGTRGNSLLQTVEARGLHKRSFSGLGCLGTYDKSKFARLDRICEECYQMYREPDIHNTCR